jgi:hypothetical protein
MAYFISQDEEVHPFLAKYSEKVLQRVYFYLSSMQMGDVKYKELGICFNLDDACSSGRTRFNSYSFVYELSKTWTLYSGNESFPVPNDAYNQPKWEGYGLEERNSLLSHLMLEIKKAIK